MFYQMSHRTNIKKLLFFTLVFVTTIFHVFQTIDGKAAHTGRERDADGSYSSRNHEHGKGASHDATYDHKAILGE